MSVDFSSDSDHDGQAYGRLPGVTPSSSPSPPSGVRRRLPSAVVAGAILVATVFGGAAGSATTLYLVDRLAPASPVAEPSPVASTIQPIANEAAPQGRDPSAPAAAPAWLSLNLAETYERVSPSVVTVLVREGESVFRGGSSGGTGFFVDREGHVVTNNHVVADGTRIRVRLKDGSQYPATVVGADPSSDLAVLKADVPAEKIVVAELGDSSLVRPGDPVFAIGSPFGLEQTITAGIVSAVNRTYGVANGRAMRGLIQTDAPVNPGNSGGPLFNAAGEVIGITTSIESPVRGSVGIGFAIPSNTAQRLLPSLAAGQAVEHPWLGISGTGITADIAAELGLPVQRGVLITEVIPNSPAAQAGLRGGTAGSDGPPRGGDIIVSVDDREVSNVLDISSYLDTKKVGDTVRLGIYRNGEQQEVTVTLGAWPGMLQS